MAEPKRGVRKVKKRNFEKLRNTYASLIGMKGRAYETTNVEECY